METISDTDAFLDMGAALVGDPNADADADAHQLCPLQSIAGPTVIVHTIMKNVRTLPTDTRAMRSSRT